MKIVRWLILLAFLLSACSTDTAELPGPNEPPAETVGPVEIALATSRASATTAAAEAVTFTPAPTDTPVFTATAAATDTPAPTATLAPTATITASPTDAATATVTATPTITQSPTPTVTSTFDYPDVTVNQQANCRYGPGTAYLYRWGLYPGDKAEVHGRNWSGSWFWIKPENLDSHCWASEIVFDIQGDKMSVPVIPPRLPKTTFAGPPNNVQAVRDGNQVIVTWDPVILSEDKRRGYLLEVSVCQNSVRIPLIVHTDDTRYQFTDDQDCSGESDGLLYTAEKHGYSDPVDISWPD